MKNPWTLEQAIAWIVTRNEQEAASATRENGLCLDIRSGLELHRKLPNVAEACAQLLEHAQSGKLPIEALNLAANRKNLMPVSEMADIVFQEYDGPIQILRLTKKPIRNAVFNYEPCTRWSDPTVSSDVVKSLWRPERDDLADFHFKRIAARDLPETEFCSLAEACSWFGLGRALTIDQLREERQISFQLWEKECWPHSKADELLAVFRGDAPLPDIDLEIDAADDQAALDRPWKYGDGPLRGAHGAARVARILSKVSSYYGREVDRTEAITLLHDDMMEQKRLGDAGRQIIYAICIKRIRAKGREPSEPAEMPLPLKKVHLTDDRDENVACDGNQIARWAGGLGEMLWADVRVAVADVLTWKAHGKIQSYSLDDLRRQGSMTACQAISFLDLGVPETSAEFLEKRDRFYDGWGSGIPQPQTALDNIDPDRSPDHWRSWHQKLEAECQRVLSTDEAREAILAKWEARNSIWPKFEEAARRLIAAAVTGDVGIGGKVPGGTATRRLDPAEWAQKYFNPPLLGKHVWQKPWMLDALFAEDDVIATDITFRTLEVERLASIKHSDSEDSPGSTATFSTKEERQAAANKALEEFAANYLRLHKTKLKQANGVKHVTDLGFTARNAADAYKSLPDHLRIQRGRKGDLKKAAITDRIAM